MPRKRVPRLKSFEIPLLPRRQGVLFPNTAGPILVGRRTSVQLIEEAGRHDWPIAVVTQRDPTLTEITTEDIFPIATEAIINRSLKLPDGTTQVWAQGQRRLKVESIVSEDPYYVARVIAIEEAEPDDIASEALMRAVVALFEKCVHLSPTLPEDAYVMALNIEKAGWLADFIASTLELDEPESEMILATFDPVERLQRISIVL